MAKIGVSVRVNIDLIDMSRVFQGANGRYVDLTMFLDTENESQYEDHGFISQSIGRSEREQGIKTPILGSGKVFSSDIPSVQQSPPNQHEQSPKPNVPKPETPPHYR